MAPRRRSQRRRQPVVNDNLDVKRIEAFKHSHNDQSISPLFSILPAEMRDIIFEYALADYEDLSQPYDLETCYRRPGYMGPRKTDTALLRTCQAIYNEAWYLPWTQAQHTFFLTAGGRKPSKTTTVDGMQQVTHLIDYLHPDIPIHRKEVANIQIFAQAWQLEPGEYLQKILSIPHFYPRTVTITLRHTDIWWWEQDQPIFINTPFVRKCRFPASVTHVRFQIESTERRKAQVDYVANKAREEWFFQRSDGVHLVCDSSQPLPGTQWTGSSTWEGYRWLRDENDNAPGMLQYYLVTLSFKPSNQIDDAAGYEARKTRVISAKIEVSADIASKTQIAADHTVAIPVGQAEEAGITTSMSASEAIKIWNDYEAEKRSRPQVASSFRRYRH